MKEKKLCSGGKNLYYLNTSNLTDSKQKRALKMKIQNDAQQPALISQTAENNVERTERTAKGEAAVAEQKAQKKPASPQRDTVQLSASLTAGTQSQQDLQARKVESIKARIQAGTYKVDSRDVAEKILADPFGF